LRPRQDPRPVPIDRLDVPIKPRPFSPSETTNSGRELDWFEPELARRRAAASAAQTRGDSAKILVESLEF
ncbi:hypothetical protein Prudu_015506, partial [Prunus dulcis]